LAKQKQNGRRKPAHDEFLGKSAEDWLTEVLRADKISEFRKFLAAGAEIFRSGNESLIQGLEQSIRVHHIACDLAERGIPFDYIPGRYGFTAAIAIKGGKSKNPKRAAPAAMPLGPFAEPSDTENEKPPV
jgi:hypothetical protein